MSRPFPACSSAQQSVSYTREAYFADCLARKAEPASSFVTDNRGFTATIQVEEDTPVFFSVPYEDGWTATVQRPRGHHLPGKRRFHGGRLSRYG